MRSCLALACLLAGAACAEPDATPYPETDSLDAVWSAAIHPGDVFVLVPGTGATGYLATPIEALAGDHPLVDVRKMPTVASDAIVFEQAIGAAHLAGITDDEIQSGGVTFTLWGCGFQRLAGFDYLSFEGLRVPIQIIGGQNAVANGTIFGNLLSYSKASAQADAVDLAQRTQTWLAVHPATAPRNVIFASHSYGGAVAEYLAYERPAITAAAGPLMDGAVVASTPLTIGAGVPGFLLGYTFPGPGLRGRAQSWIYEIDRPDDPVHAMNPSGNSDGHDYDIMLGTDFVGAYGVTTEEITCKGTPGACPLPH